MPTAILKKYFALMTPVQQTQFDQLKPLYELWNAQINVISRKDIEALYERHVLHSLGIYRFVPFQPGSRILDIGTGGGFPGIPLAIMQPDVNFVLVDSIGKKIKVVNEVVQSLQLKNVVAYHQRAEMAEGKFDFVLTRAVAELSQLMTWSQNKISKNQLNAIPNGLICLKGGDLKEELKAAGRSAQVFELSDYFNEEFFESKKLVYVPL